MQLLRGKAEELRSKLGGRVSMARLLAVVADVPCPSRCVADLSHPVYGNIDSFYNTRHEFLRTLLTQSLWLELRAAGWKARLAAEGATTFAHGDIDIRVTRSAIDISTLDYRVVLEIKGGKHMNINQCFRTLADEDVDAVVVMMAARGADGVFSITRNQAKGLLAYVADTYSKKMETLIENSSELLDGPWCAGCQIQRCTYSRPARDHKLNFEREFVTTLPALPEAIDKATHVVLELLNETRVAKHDVGGT